VKLPTRKATPTQWSIVAYLHTKTPKGHFVEACCQSMAGFTLVHNLYAPLSKVNKLVNVCWYFPIILLVVIKCTTCLNMKKHFTLLTQGTV
jgi:hypothetical protein